MHLNAPGLNVIGAGEPALPGVSIGHNGKVAFGLTIFSIDQEDLYVYQTNPANPNQYRYGGGWENFKAHHPEDFERFRTNEFPFGRLGRAEEIGDVAAFLLSARASWVTGANVPVDGGQGRPSARKF